jgi:uncharacterized protein YjiK
MKKEEISFKISISFLLLLTIIALNTCANSGGIKKTVSPIGYLLTEPDKTTILPGHLMEISGMTIIDSSTVACVQDEKGVVYIFDLLNDDIKKQIHFGNNGDYEGIARVDSDIYVLRSDGVLFKIANFRTSSFASEIALPWVKAENNEGLCYDKENNRLLIAPKEKHDKGPGYKENHLIYGFDTKADSLFRKPVMKINLSQLTDYLVENKIIHQKKEKKKNNKDNSDFTFKPSEICIHPITDKIYILCAEERMLFVFDRDGTIEYAEKLDSYLFNVPEGLAFFENGDMLVSNESGNQYPVIMRFNYRKK